MGSVSKIIKPDLRVMCNWGRNHRKEIRQRKGGKGRREGRREGREMRGGEEGRGREGRRKWRGEKERGRRRGWMEAKGQERRGREEDKDQDGKGGERREGEKRGKGEVKEPEVLCSCAVLTTGTWDKATQTISEATQPRQKSLKFENGISNLYITQKKHL